MRHHVLITGAGGYVGSALAARLREQLREGRLASLTLADTSLPEESGGSLPGLYRIEGDLAQPAVLRDALAHRPDRVFHLAGVTSRQAGLHPDRSLRANVLAGIGLFESLDAQDNRPVLVFASSIAVHGVPLPARLDDATAPKPTLTYGAHKRVVEILLADYARRGRIDARCVRLSGVVARPGLGAALSSFASDMIRTASAGTPFICPVGPQAQVLLISLPLCVENLLRVASAAADPLPEDRTFHMPALRVGAGDLARALQKRFAGVRITWEPQAGLEAQFACWPELQADAGERIGLRNDGSLESLITHALENQAIVSRTTADGGAP